MSEKILVEGPLGFEVTEAQALAIESQLKKQPKGKEFEYRHIGVSKAVEVAGNDRTDVSVISSETVDRDREMVMVSGIEYEQYLKNPVVTWNHNRAIMPVGKCMWIRRQGSLMKAKTMYAERPEDMQGEWMPDTVWHMVRNGYLPGKSIGFLPLKGHCPMPDEIAKRPELAQCSWIFDKVQLYEYAVATVQSNPDSVLEAIGKGLATELVCKQLGLIPEEQAVVEQVVKDSPDFGATLAELVATVQGLRTDFTATVDQKLTELRTELLAEIDGRKPPVEPQKQAPEKPAEKPAVDLDGATFTDEATLADGLQNQIASALAAVDLKGLIRDSIDRARGRV